MQRHKIKKLPAVYKGECNTYKKQPMSKEAKRRLLVVVAALFIGLLRFSECITLYYSAGRADAFSASLKYGFRSFFFALFWCWVAKTIFEWIYRKTYNHLSVGAVDEMEGHKFEEYLKIKFEAQGYSVKWVGENGNDYGVDLIISKAGKKTAVQAKRYKNSVGIAAIQEVASGKQFYACDHAIVVTNSYYTKAARQLAAKCDVELWTRDDMIKNLGVAQV